MLSPSSILEYDYGFAAAWRRHTEAGPATTTKRKSKRVRWSDTATKFADKVRKHDAEMYHQLEQEIARTCCPVDDDDDHDDRINPATVEQDYQETERRVAGACEQVLQALRIMRRNASPAAVDAAVTKRNAAILMCEFARTHRVAPHYKT